jgi:predicted enzyme related to lactoylglutathione lyase
MAPTLGNGKICYLEIPAGDVEVSAAFYRNVFGWDMHTRGGGAVTFNDSVGEVNGAFVTGRAAAREIGLLVYIMVYDAAAALAAITAGGGRVVEAVDPDELEVTARFADPFGNIFGIYQQPRAI